MSFKKFSTAALFLAWVGGAASVLAQQPAQGVGPNLSVEGDWVRTGSPFGLGGGVPPAPLLPGLAGAGRGGGGGRGAAPAAGRGAAAGAPAAPANQVGQAYVVVEQPCAGGGQGPGGGGGALGINPDSGGIHIVVGKDAVVLAPERGGARHIYMDGRPHPDLARWVPTNAGHSVGRLEGNVLVVETIGLAAANVPGGGMRTPETKLTERMEVAADGKTMTITYTYDDPKIYAKPHTYRYTFDRIPGVSYAFENWCDPGDPVEKQGITPPKQL